MNIRQRTEEIERKNFSSYAKLSSASKGRLKPEKQDPIRTCFQRDRDRIIHSKAFRRLKHKTQVFISPEGDHYRTRLTHTLEVSQIGRTIARSLRLNEDLVEAIALGHDLGHTPFGHTGEYALNEICPFGFKHYEQSLRVVDVLEKNEGINLTYEVRDGIVNHTGDGEAQTLEGKIIKFADRIAYINHDIDDAIRGGIISKDDLPNDCLKILGSSHKERINTMIIAVISESMDKPCIMMKKDVHEATMRLREFMFEKVYIASDAKKEEKKVQNIIYQLYNYFIDNPEDLPDEFRTSLKLMDAHRVVCDYIAGMTDRYALHVFHNLFIPTSWQHDLYA